MTDKVKDIIGTAIHPDYFRDIREVKDKMEAEPLEIREERALAELSETAGWKVLEEYIGLLKETVDNLLKRTMESGASFDEIGQKTIVITLVKSYLDQILEKVDNARSAIESK
jgi:hypothetical protein